MEKKVGEFDCIGQKLTALDSSLFLFLCSVFCCFIFLPFCFLFLVQQVSLDVHSLLSVAVEQLPLQPPTTTTITQHHRVLFLIGEV